MAIFEYIAGDVKTQISGRVIKNDSSHQFPKKLALMWTNFLDGDDIRDGTAWKRLGGTSFMGSNGNFDLIMDLPNHEFENNITTHPATIQRWSDELTLNQTEQFKKIKFAMGYVVGVYNDDFQEKFYNQVRRKFDTGPNGEQAYADMYAIFYTSGPMDEYIDIWAQRFKEKCKRYGRICHDPSCEWWAQLPKGFSCGRAAPPDPNCGGKFDRYVQFKDIKIIL